MSSGSISNADVDRLLSALPTTFPVASATATPRRRVTLDRARAALAPYRTPDMNTTVTSPWATAPRSTGKAPAKPSAAVYRPIEGNAAPLIVTGMPQVSPAATPWLASMKPAEPFDPAKPLPVGPAPVTTAPVAPAKQTMAVRALDLLERGSQKFESFFNGTSKKLADTSASLQRGAQAVDYHVLKAPKRLETNINAALDSADRQLREAIYAQKQALRDGLKDSVKSVLTWGSRRADQRMATPMPPAPAFVEAAPYRLPTLRTGGQVRLPILSVPDTAAPLRKIRITPPMARTLDLDIPGEPKPVAPAPVATRWTPPAVPRHTPESLANAVPSTSREQRRPHVGPAPLQQNPLNI